MHLGFHLGAHYSASAPVTTARLAHTPRVAAVPHVGWVEEGVEGAETLNNSLGGTIVSHTQSLKLVALENALNSKTLASFLHNISDVGARLLIGWIYGV